MNRGPRNRRPYFMRLEVLDIEFGKPKADETGNAGEPAFSIYLRHCRSSGKRRKSQEPTKDLAQGSNRVNKHHVEVEGCFKGEAIHGPAAKQEICIRHSAYLLQRTYPLELECFA